MQISTEEIISIRHLTGLKINLHMYVQNTLECLLFAPTTIRNEERLQWPADHLAAITQVSTLYMHII